MAASRYTLLQVLITILAFAWLLVPQLNQYSLQLFALGLATFFIIRKISKKRTLTATAAPSYEMLGISFLFLILLGSNSDYPSLAYPLMSIFIFLIVFFTPKTNAFVATASVVLILLFTHEYTQVSDYIALLTAPILLFLFLFTKKQYDEANEDRSLLLIEEEQLVVVTSNQNQLEQFISQFLKPKLQLLQALLESNEDTDLIISQVALLETEADKQLKKITPSQVDPQTPQAT